MQIMSYIHRTKAEIDLSLSENPLGTSPQAIAVLKKLANRVSSYPDPEFSKLRKFISTKFGIKTSQIVFGTGSEQLIDLVARAFGEKIRVVVPQLTFPVIESRLKLVKAKIIKVDMDSDLNISLDDLENKLTKGVKLVFICNPNNPAGGTIDSERLVRMIKKFTKIIFAVDEANIDFGGVSLAPHLKTVSNLMIIRSFSKAYALPGLRIGYLITSLKLAKKIQTFKLTIPLTSFSEDVALAVSNDTQHLEKSLALIKKEREFLTKQLSKREFKVFPSITNTILVKGAIINLASKLFDLGVSVVDGQHFKGLDSRFIRVAVRKRDTNSKFLRVLDQLIKKGEYGKV